MSNKTPVSIVIASLGGKTLKSTLEHLNNSTVRPHEILICIPEPEASALRLDLPNNAHLIITPKRGQVSQRAYGLSITSCELVMQLDDDVNLRPDSLELLIGAIKNAGLHSAVAPLLRDCTSGEYLTTYPDNLKGFLQSLVATLIGGAPWGARRMGCIDNGGMPHGVDGALCEKDKLALVEWLPGGCVLVRREDLILTDYFPFQGKAYCEDVIHSLLWRKKGTRLWVAPFVAAFTHSSTEQVSLQSLIADHQSRKYAVTLMEGSLARSYLWFLYLSCRQIFVIFKHDIRIFAR